MGLLAGCGKSDKPQFTTGKNTYSVSSTEEAVKDEGAKSKTSGNLYVICDIDTQLEMITFQKAVNGKFVEHTYTGGTCFYNKYGDMMPISNLEAGQVVTFEANKETDALTKVQVSADAWEKDDVENYTLDMEKNILTMGGSNYEINDHTKFFSDDGEILGEDIAYGDRIRVNGIDKKVLAVTVTTGHGELMLTNTETFDGGFIGIYGNRRYYYEISDYMSVEIPEGEYMVTFTNEGYGGSTNVTIERGETVSLDLESLKSEEPQSCLISFTATVPDTTVFVDGEQVDITQPVEVIYGTHSLQAAATGYTAWNKQLVVNSKSANIIIDLTGGKEEEEETEEETEEEETEESGTDSAVTNGNGTYNSGTYNSGTGTYNSGTYNSGTGTYNNGTYNNGSGTYAGSNAGSMAGSSAGSTAGSNAGSMTNGSNSIGTNTSNGSTTTNSNINTGTTSNTTNGTTNSSTTTNNNTNSSTNTSNQNNSSTTNTTNNTTNNSSTTNNSNNNGNTTSSTTSDNNSMSNRYNTTVDKNNTNNPATDAYLDTLSGIIDTLSGGKTN